LAACANAVRNMHEGYGEKTTSTAPARRDSSRVMTVPDIAKCLYLHGFDKGCGKC
jgi:hypothetical protein